MQEDSKKKVVVIVLLFCCSVLASSFAQVEDVQILDLAFDTYEFVDNEPFAVSYDGCMLACSIRKKPANKGANVRRLPNGTPGSCAGSQIYLFRSDNNEMVPVAVGPANGNSWRPVWSPDSRLLAFYCDVAGFPQVWVYEVYKKASRRVSNLSIQATNFSNDKVAWSPDGKTIYTSVKKEKGTVLSSSKLSSCDPSRVHVNENKPTVTLYYGDDEPRKKDRDYALTAEMNELHSATIVAIHVETGSVGEVVSDDAIPRPVEFKLSSSGRFLSYFSAPSIMSDPSYLNFDLVIARTDGKNCITTIAKSLIIADDPSQQLYQWHPYKDSLIYIKDKKLYRVDFDNGGCQVSRQLGEEIVLDLIPSPLLFTQDGTAILVGARADKDYVDRPQTLFIIPVDQGRIIELPLGKKWEYKAPLDAYGSQVWQPEQGSFTVLLEDCVTGELAVVRFYLNTTLHRQQGRPERRVLWRGDACMSNVACGRNNNLFCSYEDIGIPPNIYHSHDGFTTFNCISLIDKRLDKLTGITKEVFETVVPLCNGGLRKVFTTVLFPAGARKEDRLPAIALFYPGANFSREARRFAGGSVVTIPNYLFLSQGYALVLPDVPLGVRGDPGNPVQEITDTLLPQIYRAAALGYIDIGHLGLIGHSYGGYGVAAVISRTNMFQAAVAISGKYDLAGTYDYRWTERGQGRMGTHLWDNISRYISNSPYFLVDKIYTPFLLVHGKDDETCDVREAVKMFTGLKRLNREVSLAIYSGEGHVIREWKQPNAIDVSRRIVQFFDSHIKTKK